MTYVLAVATDDTRDLIVEALTAAADQRTTVAQGVSGQLRDLEREGKEIRSKARRVVHLLAEADELRRLAHTLKTAEAVPVISRATIDATTGALADLAGIPLAHIDLPDPHEAVDLDGSTALLDPMAEPDPEGIDA